MKCAYQTVTLLVIILEVLGVAIEGPLPYTFSLPGWHKIDHPLENRTDWISPDETTFITISTCDITPMNSRAFWSFLAVELKKNGMSITSSHPLEDDCLQKINCEEGYEATVQSIHSGIKTKTILWILVKKGIRVFLITVTAKEAYFDDIKDFLTQIITSFQAS